MSEKFFSGKRIVILFLTLVMLASAIFSVAADPGILLDPRGATRISLEDNSFAGADHGRATWNPFIQVLFGSFSAELNTGSADPSSDFASVIASPINIKLGTLGTNEITFWAYHYNNKDFHPAVDLVLDNGKMLEGVNSVSVSGGSIDCEDGPGCLGFPSSDIWVLMKPTDEFYSSFAASDPVIPDTFSNPQPLSEWKTAFPDAKVVQIRITYGYSSTPSQIFIENGRIGSKSFKLEPETTGLPPHIVP